MTRQTSRKRVCYSKAEGRPRKRKKLVDRPAMSGTFETPHPTLEARSQVYKLPSTKPISSPTPFSPVPITAPTRCLDPSTRSNVVPTTSGGLKENIRNGKRILLGQSSKSLSAFTLTPGSAPASRNTRGDVRSPSWSHNATSSRSRSRDQTRRFKSKSKFKPDIINNLSESRSSNVKQDPFGKAKSFAKGHKSLLFLANTEPNLLASPFASRVPSPTDCLNTDFAISEPIGSPSNVARTLVTPSQGLPNVPVDLNVPPHCRTQSQSKKGQLCDASSSPEKTGLGKRSSTRLFNRGIKENGLSWKNRRPSAPSNLQRPPKPVGKAHIPAKRTEKAGNKQVKEANKISRHMNKLQNRTIPCPVEPIKDDNDLGVDNPGRFFWMQERSAIDFNRPPSQISFHLSPGFHHPEDDAVFWSSGEDNDDNDDQLNQHANLEATNSTWLTSTPYKKGIARRPSVPILKGSSFALPDPRDFGKARSVSMCASSKISTSVGDNDKSGEAMELTAPLEGGESCQKDSMSLHEHTPWITDSIISPPTAYSERKKPVVNVEEKRVDENLEKEEQIVSAEPGLKTLINPSLIQTQTGLLSSPFESSYASTSSPGESASMGLYPMVGENQERHTIATISSEGASQRPSQRTRSGTILVTRNGAAIARRTRTGTIVGPSSIGRTRSGTIVAKTKVSEQNVGVGGNRRIGSDSIIGPVPDLSLSGKKAVRARTTSLEPKRISDLVGAEEEVGAKSELTQLEKVCNANAGTIIQEVNEAECYVDSSYLTSSPDPIDFLTGAKTGGDESTLVVAVGEWQVADEPPSPEIRRTKKKIQTPRGVGRSITRRFKLKGNRTNRASFLGAGQDISDDELLLVEGQSQGLFD